MGEPTGACRYPARPACARALTATQPGTPRQAALIHDEGPHHVRVDAALEGVSPRGPAVERDASGARPVARLRVWHEGDTDAKVVWHRRVVVRESHRHLRIRRHRDALPAENQV